VTIAKCPRLLWARIRLDPRISWEGGARLGADPEDQQIVREHENGRTCDECPKGEEMSK
jgi:hypothetical protein